MNHRNSRLYLALAMMACIPFAWAQQPPPGTPVAVPRLVQFSGVVKEAVGRPVAGVTFAFYKNQEGGTPIWLETQNVTLDENGRYTVLLGSTKSAGLPMELFASGEARWLGIQPEGQPEQPRVLLLSVPYALKAGDAETVGGLPPSAFMLAGPPARGATTESATATDATAVNLATLSGSGTLDFIPLWTPDGSTLGNSIMFQSTSSNIGIGTQTPSARLDIAGSAKVRGTLLLPAAGAATASAGKNSEPLNLAASAFNSGTAAAVNQTFSWRAEPAGNDTASPSGTLNLLFGSGTSVPTETGLQISSGGVFTFVPGQTFPGAGTITGVTAGSGLTGGGTSGNVSLGLLTSCAVNQVLEWNGSAWICTTLGTGSGTITGVTAGTDLTGGGTTGTVTLNLDTTKVPQLATANTFTANQSITGNLSLTGGVSAAAGTFSGNLSTTGNLTSQTGVFTGTSATPLVQLSQSGTGAGMSVSASGNDGMDVFSTAPSKSAVFAEVTGAGATAIKAVAFNSSATAMQAVGAVQVGTPLLARGNQLEVSAPNQLGLAVDGPSSGVGAGLDFQYNDTLAAAWEVLATGNTAAQGAGKLNFRDLKNGNDLLTLDSNTHQVGVGRTGPIEKLDVAGRVRSQNLAAVATASGLSNASSGQCLGVLTSGNSFCDTPSMSLTETTGNVPVLIMFNGSGIQVDSCPGANFYLVMDGRIIAQSVLQTNDSSAITSDTLVSLQFPTPGSHTFEVQESDDTGGCSGGTNRTQIGVIHGTVGDATRTLIVREL